MEALIREAPLKDHPVEHLSDTVPSFFFMRSKMVFYLTK